MPSIHEIAARASHRAARAIQGRSGDPAGKGRQLLVWLPVTVPVRGEPTYATRGIPALRGPSRKVRQPINDLQGIESASESFRFSEADRSASGAAQPVIGWPFLVGYSTAERDQFIVTNPQSAAGFWELEGELMLRNVAAG